MDGQHTRRLLGLTLINIPTMCLFRRRKQDRIAREIAKRHDMLADYRAARRNGLSPLEALEEWDLLDEEARKKLR